MSEVSEFAVEAYNRLSNRNRDFDDLEIARSINSVASNVYGELYLMFSPDWVGESDEGKLINRYVERETTPSKEANQRMSKGLKVNKVKLNSLLDQALDEYQQSIGKWLQKDGHGDFK